jgi:hypothetical protein
LKPATELIVTDTDSKVWFPEPTTVDGSSARNHETWFHWISRATSEKGIRSRQFLNENIAKVPEAWQSKLYHNFRTRDWHTVFFELIVGRTLQILGASIEVEQSVEETSRRPDFRAQFPDRAVTVEATVPELNRVVGKRMDWNEELVEIIESLTPEGWSVQVWHVPELGPNDSKREFKRTIAQAFAGVPTQPPADATPIEITDRFGADLRLTLWPGRIGGRVAGVRGVASGVDDTEERIRAAVTYKKKQVRNSTSPVVLAISASPFGGLDDFDQALYGLTFESVDQQGKTIRTGFKPTGVFGRNRPEPPTYAAVLAYRSVGFTEVVDPVLYLHPRSKAKLPEALMNLQVRSLDSNGVQIRAARMKNALAEMNFVVLGEAGTNATTDAGAL